MTELDLYKYITENEIEYRWVDANTFIILLNFFEIKCFQQILGEDFFDDCTMPVELGKNCIVVELNSICDYFGIDLQNIFDKKC